jgi:hypothetical protein
MISSARLQAIELDVTTVLAYAHDDCDTFGPIQDGDGDYYKDLEDQADDTILPGIFSSAYEGNNREVVVNTPEELTYAVDLFCHKTQITTAQGEISSEVRHEWQHAMALRHLGVESVKFGFRVVRLDSQGLGWQPFSAGELATRPITKLSLAAIIAMPSALSEGDSTRIKQMGYNGPHVIAERAVNINTAAGKAIIPVPLSCSTYSELSPPVRAANEGLRYSLMPLSYLYA